MIRSKVFRLVVLGFLLTSIIETTAQRVDLRTDLEKYKGYYTSIEMTGGKISMEKIPAVIRNSKKSSITNTSIQYLEECNNGYILTFNVVFGDYHLLVVSTLDNEYVMQDYRTYTDGTGAELVKNDTIAMASFGPDYIDIEIMHPNLYEEPWFPVDGIRKEKLIISNDLKLLEE